MNIRPIDHLLTARELTELRPIAANLSEEEARNALELLELEENTAGTDEPANFDLSEHEVAAARLLRHEIARPLALAEVKADVKASRQRLDAMSTPKPKRVHFTEQVPTTFVFLNR